MWEIIQEMAGDRLWIYTGIAGALLGAAFLAWFKDTRMGLWMYSKFDSFLNFLVERWGWTWFKQDENAWRKRYPKIVKKIGSLFIEKLHKNKIATVIKHIPGHGLAKSDSHTSTPKVKNNLKYLIKNDFFPFKNQKSLFAMTAHIIFESIDPILTATHSKKMINIIRNKIMFKNIIISDDISMKALKFSIEENTIKAFSAGCNIVLHCNGKMSEMIKVAKNSPKLDSFLMKKTSEFYKLIT